MSLSLPFPDDVTPPLRRCGLDEVGRGALAGPLVAAGVILPVDIMVRLGEHGRFLRDSKTVPPARRREMADLLAQYAVLVEISVMPVELINEHGIGWANREAFRVLIGRISADEYIVDGKVKPATSLDRSARVRCLVKADTQVPEVAAASLVAKVYRDGIMAELHREFPLFGWDRNSGYGTAAHLAALREYGSVPPHRRLFIQTALLGSRKHPRELDQVVCD